MELKDVFGLVRRYRAWGVKLNIETKVEAGAPEQTQPRSLFVRRVFQEIRADDFGGDAVRAADALPGVKTLSPVYGFPQNGTVADPAFRFYVSREMVRDAHARGLKVVPWTVDDPATVQALMDFGIDGLITDYPDRVRRIMAERGLRLPRAYAPPRAG